MTAAGTATTVDRGVFPSVTGPVSVHSVFATAANLSTSAGLVSVVAGSRPAGPHTIVTNLRPLDGLALEPGQTGHITPARLRMGRLDLDLTRATDWRPAPVDGRPLGTAVADLAARLAGVRLGEGRTGATAETTRSRRRSRPSSTPAPSRSPTPSPAVTSTTPAARRSGSSASGRASPPRATKKCSILMFVRVATIHGSKPVMTPSSTKLSYGRSRSKVRRGDPEPATPPCTHPHPRATLSPPTEGEAPDS